MCDQARGGVVLRCRLLLVPFWPPLPLLVLSLLPSLSLTLSLSFSLSLSLSLSHSLAPCQYQPRLFGYAATGGAAGPPGASPTSDADWDANVDPGGTATTTTSGGGRGQLRRAVGVPVPSGARTPRGGALSDVPLVPLSKAGGRGGDSPGQALLPPGQNSSGKGLSGRGMAAASAAVVGAEEEGWTGEVGGTFRPDTFAFTMDNPLPPAGTSGRGLAAYAPPPPPPYPGAGGSAAGAPSSGARRPAADPFASSDPFGTGTTTAASPVSPSPSASAAAAGAESNNWDWMDRDSALPSAPGALGPGAGGLPSGGRSGNKRFAGSDEGLI